MVIFGFSLFFVSCAKQEITMSTNNNEKNINITKTIEPNFNDDAIELGEKLRNPYSIENMTTAYNNLKSIGKVFQPNFRVYTSHLYVRFLPNDELQLDILNKDENIELYDYPLDYEIITTKN